MHKLAGFVIILSDPDLAKDENNEIQDRSMFTDSKDKKVYPTFL